MRAIVVDPSSRLGFDFADVVEPQAAEGQLLVAVAHASLNRGDLNDARSGRLAPGAVLGSDVAGVVVQMASDGSGPPSASGSSPWCPAPSPSAASPP
jgi:NADPH2:quinone reductase